MNDNVDQNSHTIKGAICSLDYLYELVAELKSVKRRLITNMYMDAEKLTLLIKYNKLYFEYKPGSYLSLWYDEWGYSKLFFYIIETKLYYLPNSEKELVCDLIFNTSTNNDTLIQRLKELGFSDYSKFHKWVKKSNDIYNNGHLSNIKIINNRQGNFYEMIKDNFDIYTDYVPELDDCNYYFDNKKCYSALDQYDNSLVGGLVVSVKGNTQTEEFVFSKKDTRGKGVATSLHCFWYNDLGNINTRFFAWIREDNEASKVLHKKFNYEKQKTYKLTMIRR